MAGISSAGIYKNLFGDSSYIVHYLQALGYDLGKVVQTGSNFGPSVGHESPFLSTVGTGTLASDGLNMMNADFTNTSSGSHVSALPAATSWATTSRSRWTPRSGRTACWLRR